MTFDNMLSKAKENCEFNDDQNTGEKVIESTENFDVLEKEGGEIRVYSLKCSEKERLEATLNDGDVKLVQLSTGKPALILHSKHGAMAGNFSLSASSAGKMLKTIEMPLVTTTTKGDGGLILSIEKIREGISVVDLINDNALSSEAAAFLWLVIEGKVKKANVLVIGSGADRIELLNALSVFVPSTERVAVVNSVAHAPHWNEIEIPFEKAVEQASEMKFDRIIGELHLKKAKVLHYLDGRLKGLISMPGNTSIETVRMLRNHIGSGVNALDVVIAIYELSGVKTVEICEVSNGSAKPLYAVEKGQLIKIRLESEFLNHAIYRGVSRNALEQDLEQKKMALEEWRKTGKRSNVEIRRAIKKCNC